eukprot:scaffold106347_cov30-Phaeocystis_antarctica.AAC.1
MARAAAAPPCRLVAPIPTSLPTTFLLHYYSLTSPPRRSDQACGPLTCAAVYRRARCTRASRRHWQPSGGSARSTHRPPC